MLVRIGITGHWGSMRDVWNEYAHMSMDGNGYWKWFQLVYEPPYDYLVIINATAEDLSDIPKERIVVFHQEPNIPINPYLWGSWSSPSKDFLHVAFHSKSYNNLQWHLGKSYRWLCKYPIQKTRCLSTIVSGKYVDPGHRKRIDFLKALENSVDIDVFGSNVFQYKHYQGSLPCGRKEDGLFPYRYTFNAENNSIKNYVTEKLVDAILSECLCFYWGCPNLENILDSQSFVRLDLDDIPGSIRIVQQAIREDWYSQRIERIRAMKQKILHTLQFFPRLETVLLGVSYKVT